MVELDLDEGRYAWVQVARGSVLLGAQRLYAGDGASLDSGPLRFVAGADGAELLVFDLH